MSGKKYGVFLIFYVMLVGSVLAVCSFQTASQNNSETEGPQIIGSAIYINNESSRAEMLKLPLSFIENRGQVSDDVKFMIKISQATIYFTPSKVLFSLASVGNTSTVWISFEGSKPSHLVGEGLLPGIANFFIGNDSSKWIAGAHTYGSVRYESLYPGIDLVFRGTESNLKHEFVLDPGADPADIILAYDGQDNLSLEKDGSILITTAAGRISDSAPVCYQNINGSRVMIRGEYRRIDDRRIGFEIQDYDPSYPLVIDPALKYFTYLGGSGTDYGYDIAVDGNGCAYVAGLTYSLNFPAKSAYKSSKVGSSDIFIAKLAPAGSALLYSTYLGGGDYDDGRRIAVDSTGSAYVTGRTQSTNFPTKSAYKATKGGSSDAFVTKLAPDGAMLAYSTYLGGSSYDCGNGIAVDSSGSAYITGETYSTNFPNKNAYKSTKPGSSDAFVTKLDAAGAGLIYSTYLGGSSSDYGGDIAVDSSGSAYVTGTTYSLNFPTKSAYKSTKTGSSDVFITKLIPAGTGLAYSTYLGGISMDYGYGVALDRSGSVYVTGRTQSTNFPIKNAFQSKYAGGADAFAAKFAPNGAGLVYSTYLGGSSIDDGFGIAIDSSGSAYVSGTTYSNNFPIKNAYQSVRAGEEDVFITKLTPAGAGLVYSTYLGESSYDFGKRIALDSSGTAYVVGSTFSKDFQTMNAFQAANAGGVDVFITAITAADSSNEVEALSQERQSEPSIRQRLDNSDLADHLNQRKIAAWHKGEMAIELLNQTKEANAARAKELEYKRQTIIGD